MFIDELDQLSHHLSLPYTIYQLIIGMQIISSKAFYLKSCAKERHRT
jgi:hypothetical protein